MKTAWADEGVRCSECARWGERSIGPCGVWSMWFVERIYKSRWVGIWERFPAVPPE